MVKEGPLPPVGANTPVHGGDHDPHRTLCWLVRQVPEDMIASLEDFLRCMLPPEAQHPPWQPFVQ